MSTPIDQGISDESIDLTKIHAFMVSINKHEKNDTIRRACEKIIYDIMTPKMKSSSLSTSNITSPFGDGPCFESSSSPVDKIAMSSATTKVRSRRHDGGASIQVQPTSHCRNKQELAPIVSCPHRRTMSLCESGARPESSFMRTCSTGRSIPESALPKSSCFSTIRRSTNGGSHVSWRNTHSVFMFDVDESPTKNTASTCQMYRRRNVNATMEPLVFPPLPFANGHCDDIRGTRGSGSSIPPGGAHLTSASGSSSLGSIRTSPRKPSILPGYSLGQSPKNLRHMNIPTTRDAGAEYAATLRPLDFAFVLRSDKNWVYGIVCDIIGPNGKIDNTVGPLCHQPSIRFAIDTHGSTKTIQKKNWGHKIRLEYSADVRF